MSEFLWHQLERLPGFHRLWCRNGWGSLPTRVHFGVCYPSRYAPYLFGVFRAAEQAAALKLSALSVIEFGVAGGNGLVALERISAEIARYFGIRIDVYGFDSGTGLPPPTDYRDLPHVWQGGAYSMDVERLKARLNGARLVLGDVAHTTAQFATSGEAEPVGFISFDLDYYSSTKAAFQIFQGPPRSRLPRVYLYFDDLARPEVACHNEFVGETLAIREFNESQATQKICKLPLLQWLVGYPERWQEQLYVHHDFSHPDYTRPVTKVSTDALHLR